MQKAIEYCLRSQTVTAQVQREHDLKIRDELISDAQSWFVLAEIELWLEDRITAAEFSPLKHPPLLPKPANSQDE